MTELDEPDRMKPSAARPADDAASGEAVAGFDPIEHEAYDWVARYMGGAMKPADIEAMRAWYGQSPAHAAAYAEVRRVWQGLGPAASVALREGEGEGEAVRRAADHVGERRPALGRRAVLGGALAASAAAAGYLLLRPPLDLWPSYAELRADYRTGAGEQRQVTLADTTSLHLNTRTSIAIRSQTADAARIELIAGEMAVSTGAATASLTVVAAAGRVVATKANFNLRCEGEDVRVSCLAGDLRVERAGRTVALAAGQQVGYNAQGMGAVAATDPDSVTAWRRGLLIFDAMPVAQVIAEVNRYRPGRIVLMNAAIGRRLLSARLRIAEADKIVVQIVHIFGAKATALPGGIVILT